MRISKLLLICICCLIAAPAVWGQAANSQAHHGILGYLDPHTGAFRPVAPQAEDAAVEPPALATVTGTITVTFTITIKTAGITAVNCSAITSVTEVSASGSRTYDETGSAAGTATGTTRTCKVTINYAWSLATASSDTMTTTYGVSGAGSATGAQPTRTTGLFSLDSRKVPSTGTTTALTASVTL